MPELVCAADSPRSVECPYCHAAPGVHCRTLSGNLTGKYGTRVNHYRREVAARRAAERAAAESALTQLRERLANA